MKRDVRLALGLPKFWNKDVNQDTAANTISACPKKAMVVVSGGQSNAANSYDPAPASDGAKDTFMFFSGHCYVLKSPVLGASGDRDSLWPSLGKAISTVTAEPVVFINGAVGGSQIGDWLDERSGYLQRLSQQINSASSIGLTPDVVLWIQGETDAAVQIDPDLYARQQKALVERLSASSHMSDVPWMLFMSTRCLHRKTNGPQIEDALKKLAIGSHGRMLVGPEMSSYDDSFRHDECHMNTRGRDRLVEDTMTMLEAANVMKPR